MEIGLGGAGLDDVEADDPAPRGDGGQELAQLAIPDVGCPRSDRRDRR